MQHEHCQLVLGRCRMLSSASHHLCDARPCNSCYRCQQCYIRRCCPCCYGGCMCCCCCCCCVPLDYAACLVWLCTLLAGHLHTYDQQQPGTNATSTPANKKAQAAVAGWKSVGWRPHCSSASHA
jgi:hypothetical protein